MNKYIVAERKIEEQLTPQWSYRCLSWTLLKGIMEPHYVKGENGTALPREDRQFLKKVEDRICYRGDMHHEIHLSFREENVQLPNDHLQEVQCLHSLKKRLQGDPKYHADYTSFKYEIIVKRYV